jgi:glycosyltransferase involved in cell wall biosynthesis
MVVLEAQAMGTPVVAYRTGGLPEAVQHGVTGLLAETGNVEQLAEYILRYLRDSDFWVETSEQCIKWIDRRFDIQKQTRELEAIYESLLFPKEIEAEVGARRPGFLPRSRMDVLSR